MKAGKSLGSKLNNEDTLRPYEKYNPMKVITTPPPKPKNIPPRLKTNPPQEREITTRATQ